MGDFIKHYSGKRRTKSRIILAVLVIAAVFAIAIFVFMRFPIIRGNVDISDIEYPDWIDSQVIAVNGGARRGQPLDAVRNIVVHYVGNPNTTAQQNHDFFAGPNTEVSSHFLVGLKGEVIQCIPLNEKSSATNERNKDTISIEVCHPDETGKFTQASYDSLVRLSAWLCQQFDLSEMELIRHFDVTGKKCPLYFVEHEEQWTAFKADVGEYLKNNPAL